MNEIWKDIIDYEGLYQASNLGRIKSLRFGKEKILTPALCRGYEYVTLTLNKKQKNTAVHKIVYEAFNGKTDLFVDHIIEGNKTDNRLNNLQAITHRKNISKRLICNNKTSKFTGVYWHKVAKKWAAFIYINGKNKYLGLFESEIEASNTYNKNLANI